VYDAADGILLRRWDVWAPIRRRIKTRHRHTRRVQYQCMQRFCE
jgi:hypothetical protein